MFLTSHHLLGSVLVFRSLVLHTGGGRVGGKGTEERETDSGNQVIWQGKEVVCIQSGSNFELQFSPPIASPTTNMFFFSLNNGSEAIFVVLEMILLLYPPAASKTYVLHSLLYLLLCPPKEGAKSSLLLVTTRPYY